ncbi:MAG TPA: hypothetical protein PKA42_00245 [Candidatus Paceibacterota bacterium]|nr:hypothetical protein [Candidatus Paceibacterota bacterium]HMO82575.1 hypothetical protein [Candidatus Paceibacterota bacterium]
MKFDRYTIGARLFPAMLASVPFFVLSHYYISPKVGDFVTVVSDYVWVGDVTITVAGIFLLMQASRWISKPFFEDRIFNKGKNFPTTSFLLFSDDFYSNAHTQQIHAKISVDFSINLHTEREEAEDLAGARQRIKEVISLIRNAVGDNGLVLQHNIEYGFARNLTGASVLAVVISLLNLGLFHFIEQNITAFTISVLTLVLYGAYVLLGSNIMKYLGNNYADVFLNEYLKGRN